MFAGDEANQLLIQQQQTDKQLKSTTACRSPFIRAISARYPLVRAPPTDWHATHLAKRRNRPVRRRPNARATGPSPASKICCSTNDGFKTNLIGTPQQIAERINVGPGKPAPTLFSAHTPPPRRAICYCQTGTFVRTPRGSPAGAGSPWVGGVGCDPRPGHAGRRNLRRSR